MHTVYYDGVSHGWKIQGPLAPLQTFTNKRDAELYAADLDSLWIYG